MLAACWQPRACPKCAPFIVVLLVVLTVSLLANRATDPLSEVNCASLAALSVFSHRGLSGEGNERRESAIPTAESMVALHHRGITHFDMDLFFTVEAEHEHELYVGHPDTLANVLGVPDVGALSSRQLARAIAAVAPARQLLSASRLLELAARYNWSLALDLKGAGRPAFRNEMERLAAQAPQ